ncbi:hypothetical protein [Lentzea californiensis]|uniref:hypothetical protein n=1 Tax=Lentzea californiensis TaxID=438851 RepID=UPI00216605FA|nr:hypothetical protein [Lentzea californiensis]
MTEDEPYYWSLDIPGLTSGQVPSVASAVEDKGLDLQVLPVDPAVFLTLHLDQHTVEALVAGLAGAQSGPILDGIREVFVDWLAWLDTSPVEPKE